MKLAYTNGKHHNATEEWKRRELFDWLTDIFIAPSIQVEPRCTFEIRAHVSTHFENEGWAMNPTIDDNVNLKVTAMKDDLAFQLQTGNISRALYDLLKLQYLFQAKKIEAAALALPTKIAAGIMGSNYANAERICRELELFDRVITVPILVVAFD